MRRRREIRKKSIANFTDLRHLIESAVKCARPTATRNHLNEWKDGRGWYSLGLDTADAMRNLELFRKHYSLAVGRNNNDENFCKSIVDMQQKRVLKLIKLAGDNVIGTGFNKKADEVLDVLKSHGMYLNCIAERTPLRIAETEDSITFTVNWNDRDLFPFTGMFYYNYVNFERFEKYMIDEVKKSKNLDWMAAFFVDNMKEYRPGYDTPGTGGKYENFFKKITWLLPYIYEKTNLPIDKLKTAINTCLIKMI